MKIFVKAKPNSAIEFVEKVNETDFMVSVREPPIGGRANRAIVKALAGYFGVAFSRIRLISGFTSKQKIFEIE